MSYKWKLSQAQRQAFKEKMQNPAEQAAYEQRKRDKADKRRAGSKFNYDTAGGQYVPTKQQHDFCWANPHLAITSEQRDAFNMVMSGYSCQMKVSHDYIHIVNEIRRTADL